MTTAEKYRQLEKSPPINIARYIFSCLKSSATNSTLGDEMVEIKTGKTPSKQNKKFYEDDFLNWFKPDEIGSEKYVFEAKDKLSKFAFENNQATIYEPDTILINAIGDVGRISILKVKASSNQQITGIRLNKKIDIDYAYFYLLANRHFFYVDLFQTTLPIVNQKKINSIPIVYPGIKEQRNIVEGLIELDKIKSVEDLIIIDKLNWNEDYKNACRNFFSVQFNSKNISTALSHQLNLVKKLRQQLLQDAVQGKLVKQNKKDEPASELLKKIKAEKQKLIAEKKLKKEKELPPIKPEEIPFEIPENWVWSRLGEIIYDTEGGKSPNCLHEPAKDKEWGVIKTTAVQEMYFLENENKVLPSNFIVSEQHKVLEGDILITRAGPKNRVGVVCCVENLTRNLILSDKTIRMNHSKELLYSKFIALALNSPLIKPLIEQKMTGMADSQVNITQDNMKGFLIPLPPLSEQNRIVQKFNELMQFCNELEASIKQSEIQNEKLLQQVLREALREEPVGV